MRAGERHRSSASRRRSAQGSFVASIAASGRADTPGHGLGLSIAETIADLHGFELTVEDNQPRGAFRIARGGAKAGALAVGTRP